MQVQKDGARHAKSDVFLIRKALAHANVAKLRLLAMRFLQRGHDGRPIASQLQHDYLPVIEGE